MLNNKICNVINKKVITFAKEFKEIFNEIFVQIYKIMEKQTNDYRDFLTEGQRIRLKRNQEIKSRYQSYLDRGIRPWRAVCRLSTEFHLSTSAIYAITNYNGHIL